MKLSTPHKLVALVFTLSLVAAACGQKDGVHVAGGQATSNQQSFETAGGGGGSTTDDLGETTSGGGDGGGTRTVTRTVGGDGGGGTSGGGGAGGSAAGGGGLTAQGSDRTGVSDSKITLAIHAPVTGAAPLPAASFEKFKDLYWKWVTDDEIGPGETVLGRSEVEVLFRDDKYSPSSARQVCRELASNSFMLVGGGGTDQIQACANFADASGVPYLSAGVTERGIAGLQWYFATSMSYKAQGDLLGQYVKRNFGDKKVAMIVTDTPNFDDAVEGWEAAVDQYGIDYYKTLVHPKQSGAWYNSFGNELKSNGVEVVYMLTAPVDYLQFAQQNKNEGGGPGFQYVGVGITEGLNPVLAAGCNSVDGGIYFSPFPGLDWARDNVPEYFEAAARFTPGTTPDDLGLALWSIAEAQHQMFKRYGQTFGNDLTREDFRAVVEQQQGLQGKVGPELSYTPDDHFGASQVHVIQADCAAGEHVTLATFQSSF